MVNTCCGCFNLVDVALRAALRIPEAFICTGEESGTSTNNPAPAEEQVDAHAPPASASATFPHHMHGGADADAVPLVGGAAVGADDEEHVTAPVDAETQRGSAARRC